MANPRRILRLSVFTGPDSATARKVAISTQLIGLRSRESRYSETATVMVTSSVRTTICGDQAGCTRTGGGCGRLGGSSGTPTAGGFPVRAWNPSDGADQLAEEPGDAQDARAGVGADDGADLRHHLRVAPVDLPAALGHPLGLLRHLDVLDGERVAAVLAALLEVGHQALERAPR